MGACGDINELDEYPEDALTDYCIDCAAGRPYCTEPCEVAAAEIAENQA